ncbi:hypothetical protein [Streptacidiphilus sp. EB103A]|uniref:hypothetical protein n=1 Tax=Streptacidiphilus sp. EB103A TaxID=3156275 RepID=UPI00351643C4
MPPTTMAASLAAVLNGAGPRGQITGDDGELQALLDARHAQRLGSTWYITPAGRTALAKYNAELARPAQADE